MKNNVPQLADIDDEGGTLVCYRCIAEPVLRKEIRQRGANGTCEFCETEDLKCVTIPRLAARIDPVYRQLVGYGDEYPEVTANDNVHWRTSGDYPAGIICELIECADEKIADELVDELSNMSQWEVHDGDADFYDAASDIYAIKIRYDTSYSRAWERFCELLKHERRFFSRDAKKILDEILSPILSGQHQQFTGAIRTIQPNDEDRFIYRGRIAHDLDAQKLIFAAPIKQLSHPAPELRKAGRMNPAGIGVFYGCADAKTCVAELRAPVGGTVITGRFEIIRPLRLLDLQKLEKQLNISYFSAGFMEAFSYGKFMEEFHREIRKPVIPDREALDYLPTQVLAEYLWTNPYPVDGIIFSSSQVSGDRSNVVLFPPAAVVEGVKGEVASDVGLVSSVGSHAEEDHTVMVSIRRPDPVETPPPEEDYYEPEDWYNSFEDDTSSSRYAPDPEQPPSLRLDPESLERVMVDVIQYRTKASPVKVYEEPGRPPRRGSKLKKKG